jgi:hypothetical protein
VGGSRDVTKGIYGNLSVIRSARLSRRARRVLTATVALLLLLAPLAAAESEMPVPLDIQIPLLMRVLSADRRLRERIGTELILAVVYQRTYRESRQAMVELVEVIQRMALTPVPGLPVSIVEIPLEDVDDIRAELSRQKADLCYLAPLRAVDLDGLISAANDSRAVTCTGVPAYVERGVTVGISTKGDHPQILVNLSAAKAGGVDLPSQVLKLAQVVQTRGAP